MRRRKLWIAVAVLVIVAAVAALFYLRRRAAPEAARLLPECDAVLYVNLRLIRLEHVFGQAPPLSHAPEYEKFLQKTGFNSSTTSTRRRSRYIHRLVRQAVKVFSSAPVIR